VEKEGKGKKEKRKYRMIILSNQILSLLTTRGRGEEKLGEKGGERGRKRGEYTQTNDFTLHPPREERRR